MLRDIRTFILDRDPFVRNWVTLMVARDWRTHFTGEAATVSDFALWAAVEKPHIDVVFLEDRVASDEKEFHAYQQVLSTLGHKPQTILTGLSPILAALKQLSLPEIAGYLLKDEIQYGIIWAAALVTNNTWVVTPGIRDAIEQSSSYPSGDGLVLDGRSTIATLTDREKEAARMAFLFSLERHDLADELNISKDWSYGLVSAIYKKLGLDDILEGEVEPSTYLGSNELVLSHLHAIVSELHGSPKAKDIETLAFHIFTMPEIEAF